MAEILGIGAEAILVKDKFYGFEVVRKTRIRKDYRNSVLDERIRRRRTLLEARILATCKKNGIPVPTVLHVDLDKAEIVMDYINGVRLRDIMDSLNEEEIRKYFWVLGKEVGLLHKVGIVHGDLTTSNMILVRDKIFLIDFGLSYFSKELEDRAVDIHLLLRALESTHPRYVETAFQEFVKGYREVMGGYVESILKRLEEIRMRGRYIAERRRKIK
ncbi:MAG: Kae1-associated kinase Bud32 [Thermoprotei archaeon]|nr:MAG: Kae1-associated kinase Bud32 [Thermoprotei archaeon]